MSLRVLTFVTAAAAVLLPACGSAQVNYGDSKPAAQRPFDVTPVAEFNLPWKIAFIPDGRMLITEKVGKLWLVTQKGMKVEVTGVPPVLHQGQQGLLGVYVSPTYAAKHDIFLTYAEPEGENSGLALARATLVIGQGTARLDGLKVVWRQLPRGKGGQLGGVVAWAPDGKSLFLTVGERQRFTPAQDPNSELGKILHLTLDGKPAPGNPQPGKQGARTVPLFAPPSDTEAEKTAAKTMVALPGPNLAPAETWASGFRTPYGLAFDPAGRLWEIEHGPRGGDELNLIVPGANYGWPTVSYGQNYNGKPIPKPDARPDFRKPALYWNPVIAPGGLSFYRGALFPQWRGSALTGGLVSKALVRIAFDGTTAREAERWDMGARIRDVAVGPDGALWLVEDAQGGKLLRLTPKA
ncbi:PQQ-dependent sugar dehydrogenase [Sphingomonas sp.]|uniref:PQQ-dependent sugar dehydrogenase n=1 Tax=Sphingomonas sp. TaxID=28214 RepID=UPI003B3AC8FE